MSPLQILLSLLNRHPIISSSHCNSCEEKVKVSSHGTQYGMSPWWWLLGLLSWCPILKSSHCNSLGRSGTRRFHLRVPDLPMSCSYLTTWEGTRTTVPVMATRVTRLTFFQVRHDDLTKMIVNVREPGHYSRQWPQGDMPYYSNCAPRLTYID